MMRTPVRPSRGQAVNNRGSRKPRKRLAPRARLSSWPGAHFAEPRSKAGDTTAVDRPPLISERMAHPALCACGIRANRSAIRTDPTVLLLLLPFNRGEETDGRPRLDGRSPDRVVRPRQGLKISLRLRSTLIERMFESFERRPSRGLNRTVPRTVLPCSVSSMPTSPSAHRPRS